MNNLEHLNKIKYFMQSNWFILWGALIVTTIVNVFIGYYIYISLNSIKEEIVISSKKVIGLSVSGHMIYAEKQSIDIGSDEFKQTLKNVLVSNLIVDYKRVTNNMSRKPKTEDEIVMAYEPLNNFYKNFVSKKGLNDFAFYIRDIGKSVASENLVETIVPLKTKVTRYVGNTQGFEIELLVNCAVNFYLPEIDTSKDGVGSIVITAKGDFNPSKGSIQNALGIQFDALKVTLIEKPRK